MSPLSPGSSRPLARSALVGLVASTIDLVVLGVLVDHLGVQPAWANVPALTLGLVVQFVGNKCFAFQDRSSALLRQGTLFLAIELCAFALNAGLFHVLGVWLVWPWWLARVVASAAVYFGFSYPLWSRVFRQEVRS